MKSPNIVKVVDESYDFVEGYLRLHNTPLKREQTYKATWTKSTWGIELRTRWGSINATEPRVVNVHTRLNVALAEKFKKKGIMLYTYFKRSLSVPESYDVELSIFLTDNFWRRMLNEYSLCDLATGLGPKLYPALLEMMESDNTSWN